MPREHTLSFSGSNQLQKQVACRETPKGQYRNRSILAKAEQRIHSKQLPGKPKKSVTSIVPYVWNSYTKNVKTESVFQVPGRSRIMSLELVCGGAARPCCLSKSFPCQHCADKTSLHNPKSGKHQAMRNCTVPFRCVTSLAFSLVRAVQGTQSASGKTGCSGHLLRAFARSVLYCCIQVNPGLHCLLGDRLLAQ
jgi:hypothetical protein